MRLDQQIITTASPTNINAEALQEIRRIDAVNPAQFLIEMIDCYFEEVCKLLQLIHHAIAQTDSCTLKRAAHTLQSASAMLGATVLATLAKELEVIADNQSLIDAPNQAAKIEAEYQRVNVALQIERQRSLAEIT